MKYIHPALSSLAVPLSSIKRDPKNFRLHTPQNLQAIAGSIKKFTLYKPILCRASDRVIIKGNGRHEAMESLPGATHIAAVFVSDDQVESVIRGISDNRASDLSVFDWAKLADALGKLSTPAAGIDFTSLGWTQPDLDALTKVAPPEVTASTPVAPHTLVNLKAVGIPAKIKDKALAAVNAALQVTPAGKGLTCNAY